MTTTSHALPVSPFFSIWIKPRETIRGIVKTDVKKHVLLLAMLAGISTALSSASSGNWGDHLPLISILAICIFLGPVIGIILLYLFGVIFRWTGGWLGGKASFEVIRAAYAWSSIPIIFVLPLWIPRILLFGEELFTKAKPSMFANPLSVIILLVFSVANIWSFVLLVTCMSEVLKFSAWKAFGAIILGLLVIFISLLFIGFCGVIILLVFAG